jgi:tRNA (adenine57-N1/adenine58-N1)-methyltransferase
MTTNHNDLTIDQPAGAVPDPSLTIDQPAGAVPDPSIDGPAKVPGSSRETLRLDELVLLVDAKGRRYLVTLTEGKEFQTHAGVLPHEAIAGRPEGSEVVMSKGRQRFRVFRPTLSEYVLSMPRGAQVIYPKDLGPMLMLADVGPGARVLESGVGSGALSMTMLRAGAEIVGYELREDFAARAAKNVRSFLGPEVEDRYRIEIRDCYDGIDEEQLDRVVLDLPEPWQVAPHATEALRPGGILLAYTPSIIQVTQLTETLRGHPFTEISTTEVLNRTWHVEGAAVRPDHRMVAHTGFLTRARLLAS